MREQFDSTLKGLESACTESLVYNLTRADPRYAMTTIVFIQKLMLCCIRSLSCLLAQVRFVECDILA